MPVSELSLYDIPAFIKEDFATSSDNFLKQIKFELRTFTDATGTVIHFNKEWKDTDKRLFRDQQFGRQFNDLRFIKKHLPPKIFEEQDPLSKAKKVYTFIQNNFRWNHQNKLSWEFNTKKAYETKEGSMVEINLSLIQALKAAGISTDIALLSTRDNGFVTKIHPAISDFNYLVAHIKIKGVDYFLDATDKKLPFGFLPYKCLNGDIRIFNTNKASYWFPYTPKSKNETLVYALGQINEDGSVEMKTRYIYNGYTAIEKREEMLEESVETYKKDLIDQLEDFEIVEHTIEQLDQTEKPLIETLEVTYDSDFLNDDNIYFKPFIIKRFKTNPFTLKERQYPVDLGYKRNFMYNLTFHIPEVYTVKSLPKNRKIILPDNGGELVYLLTETENKIMIKFSFSLDKTQYLPQEYNYLKEMFSQLILAQNEMVILEKNK